MDANVWVRFLRNAHYNPIINCMISYDIEVVVNNYLLSEVFDALVNNKGISNNNFIFQIYCLLLPKLKRQLKEIEFF